MTPIPNMSFRARRLRTRANETLVLRLRALFVPFYSPCSHCSYLGPHPSAISNVTHKGYRQRLWTQLGEHCSILYRYRALQHVSLQWYRLVPRCRRSSSLMSAGSRYAYPCPPSVRKRSVDMLPLPLLVSSEYSIEAGQKQLPTMRQAAAVPFSWVEALCRKQGMYGRLARPDG